MLCSREGNRRSGVALVSLVVYPPTGSWPPQGRCCTYILFFFSLQAIISAHCCCLLCAVLLNAVLTKYFQLIEQIYLALYAWWYRRNWSRPVGRPYTSWMATLKSDLSLHNLTFEDAIELALDKSLWRLLVASGATHWHSACRIMVMMYE